ncbi:MAG: ribose 5-phosphate isomerase B [Desulfobulbus propionicus]|nr:MAG: ribose 5-phosphate isomerase B [Desulfobulbus propionicus]
MHVAIGSDHGGYALKTQVAEWLTAMGHTVEDLGCFAEHSVDYPEFAAAVCDAVVDGRCHRGILICGTGIGMSMAANRRAGIRAALCHEACTSRLSREHNDANVLCLGARVLGPEVARDIVTTWMQSAFAGGRHVRRIQAFD